ncbi:MAG: maleylpyruvate isomerase family mycothiol-dependent enzyme [Actinomycetota bacterium]
MIPTDTIETMIACYEALSALGAELTQTEWATPSDLPGWSVKDNLSHLVGTERTMLGQPATAHRAPPVPYTKNPIGEANEHEVDVRRSLSGAEVLAEWNDIAAQRTAAIRAGDDDYWAQPAMTPTGPGTMADFLHIRVLDCWLHEQDIRRAIGRPGHLGGRCAEHTVDRLVRTIPIVVGKRAGTPEGGAVVIDITDGVERHIVCEVSDGRAKFVETPTSHPLTSITLTTEAFVALAGGRRTAAGVRSLVEGDQELGERVLSNFNMMI